MRRALPFCLTASLWLLPASDPGSRDWPMWGGTPDRNMVSPMAGLPTSWDIQTRKNVKWVAQLGTTSYGNPVVAGGQVYVGTNNEAPRNPKEKGDCGVLMCFRESDGKFLWQYTHAKLPVSTMDWPMQGVCSSPLVEDGRVYYVSNRCELVALDTSGKLVWKFDMMKEAGVAPHNMTSSSPASYGELVYASTSNGRDEAHRRVPSPKAPSMIAVNKKTGKLAWSVNSVGDRILNGQWSSPAVAKIGDTAQVVIGEGDGWVRSYEAATGKKLWEFDLSPKGSVWPKTRNEVIATPVVWQNKVYIASGQDPENGEGAGRLVAIDATKRGEITASGRVWQYDKIRRSISTVAIYNGLLFAADFSGFLHCLDATTGAAYWTHDLLAAVWGSPMVINGKVYLGDEDGDVAVLEAARQKKLIAEMNMGSSVYSTPVPANGTLYIMNRSRLWALAEKR
jgi:outer membrane protein assembly factor BamB